MNLRVGDWVAVRSKEEILATLDDHGCLEGMPFMPEMLRFCGQKFQVHRSAHKTCDYSSANFRSRRVDNTVHLDTRCDGSAHDGCQAGCLLYWKEAWLAPIGTPSREDAVRIPSGAGCTEAALAEGTKNPDPHGGPPTYFCQTTQIPFATRDLEWWDLRQYIDDYRSGNVGVGRIFSALVYSAYYHLSQAGIGVGRPMRWFYDTFRFLWGGSKWPRKPGVLPRGAATPTRSLNLQPGELVRIKSHEEILQTVTEDNRNRGMYWDAELVPYCGGKYRVLKRVTKIIHEQTGQMQEMKTPCIILDSVVCEARYSPCRMLCPKQMYPYWREIWLERVEDSTAEATAPFEIQSSLNEMKDDESLTVRGERG